MNVACGAKDSLGFDILLNEVIEISMGGGVVVIFFWGGGGGVRSFL